MKKTLSILLCLVMVFCCFTACGKPAGQNEPAEAKRTDLKVQLSEEPATLDFHADQTKSRSYISYNLYANLVTYGLDGSLTGELAETWDHNDDLTEWTFTLREGAKFSDGTDITMDDVIFSFQRGIELNFVPEFAQIVSVEALSDKELKFTLNAPNGKFADIITTDPWGIMSKAYVEGGADLTSAAAVTSGAYYLAEWKPGSNMILKSNEGYVLGAPAIKEVDCVFITDRNTAVVAMESKQVDLITNGATLNASELETVKTFDGVKIIPRDEANYVFMSPNFNYEGFSDVNVRKAIDLAIDRNFIIATLGGTKSPAGVIPVNEKIGGYLPGYEPKFDIEAAKALMAESAYPEGFTFAISCVASYVPVAEVIQNQLKEIGITVEIDQCADISAVVAKIGDGSYQAFMLGYTSSTADICTFAGLYNAGYNYDVPNEYGPLLSESNGYVGEARDEVLKKAYDLMADTIPYFGLYFNNGAWACDENLDYGVNTITTNLRFRTMSWK